MDFAHLIGYLFLLIIVLSLVLGLGTIVGGLANFVAGLLGHPWGKSLDHYRSHYRSQYIRPRIPPALRRSVLQRDNYVCQDCGTTSDLEIDHIIPVSKGGATSFENLQVLCHDCNQAKSNHL